ncbi:DUF4352 domain-containing protein [Streptomyces sp. WG-D5]
MAYHLLRRWAFVSLATGVTGTILLTGCGDPGSSSPVRESSSSSSSASTRVSSPPAESATSGAYSAGQTAGYKSGLKVTVYEATEFTPSDTSAGHTSGNKAYEVTVKLDNSGKGKFDSTLVYVTARAGEEGETAEQVFDSAQSIGDSFSGTLLPGKKASATYAFDAPSDAKVLDVEVDLGDFSSEASRWELDL